MIIFSKQLKKTLSIIILSCLVLMLSCDKNGFGTVEGYVYEYGTNVPIPNVYVRINKYSNVISTSPYRSGTSNKHGYYKIKYFNNYFGAKYYLDVISGEHKSEFHISFDQRKSNIITYLHAYSHYKMRIKNNLPYAVKVSAHLGIEKYYSYSTSFYVGANRDTICPALFKTNANVVHPISWYYGATASTTTSVVFHDSIPAASKFDTITHLIQVN
jgi:hypothetical protein